MSSHKRGKWRRISRGSVSAAMTMSSAMPRLSVLVASLAPYNPGIVVLTTYTHSKNTTTHLLQLLVVRRLLNDLHDRVGQRVVGERVCLGVDSSLHKTGVGVLVAHKKTHARAKNAARTTNPSPAPSHSASPPRQQRRTQPYHFFFRAGRFSCQKKSGPCGAVTGPSLY